MKPNSSRAIILLALVFLFLYGALINSSNLTEFNLQQTAVEAVVERGTFAVEGSQVPQLKVSDDNVDVFKYNGHLYAAKQPGQFLLGAVAYFFVRLLGLSYASNFVLTSALVTWLSASLIAALAAATVYVFACGLAPANASPVIPFLIAVGYGVGTTAFAYSGIAHHDVIATGFLFIAFYLLFKSIHSDTSFRANWLAGLGGILLGLVITTSMLPALMTVVVALYLISTRRWQSIAWMAVGGAVGVLPLFVYDALNFGNPFLLPNIVGDFSDTFFYLDAENFLGKLNFYATFLVQYTPLALAGLIGLAFLPKTFRREQIFIFATVLVQAGYVFNIDTFGHCQFGPRYLLPTISFLALGLIGFAHIQSRLARWIIGLAILAVGLVSTAFNLLGTIFGAMYCDIQWYAVPYYWKLLQRGKLPSFPLIWLVVPLVVCVMLLVVQWARQRRPSSASANA